MEKIVQVEFNKGHSESRAFKNYNYFTTLDLAVGDHVVVDSPFSGFTVVKVTSVQETVEGILKASKWVVCKVDDTEYKQREERETLKQLLKVKLDKAVKEARERVDYEALAQLSPEIGELVKQLKELS